MKVKYLLPMLMLCLALQNCDLIPTSTQYKYEGSILGLDEAQCACCGNWKIEIDENYYQFIALPSNSTIDLENETFPLDVKLNWFVDQNSACGHIIVESIILD